jgi:hypothetical protein
MEHFFEADIGRDDIHLLRPSSRRDVHTNQEQDSHHPHNQQSFSQVYTPFLVQGFAQNKEFHTFAKLGLM